VSVNKGIPRTCTSPKISRFRAPGAFTIQPAASFSSAIFREDRTGVPTLLPLWHAHCVNSRTCNPPNHRHPSAEIPPPPFVAPTWTARQVSWSLNLPGGTYYLAGAYTHPPFQLNVSTSCGIHWVASVCQ